MSARPRSAEPAVERSAETLVGLLERFSPTGSESEAAAWMQARMRQLGFSQVEIDGAGNSVGILGSGPAQVVLLGHLDTVPGEIEVHWEGEALYGRGAVDAKGSLAAFVDAVARVGAVPGWQWIVIGAVDEEGDSRGARFLSEAYRPAALIVGEPSGWDRVTLGYKGSAWTRATFRRPMAHSAAQHISACEAAIAYWETLAAHVRERNESTPRVFEQVTPSLRGWSSGEDGFEAWATLHLGTRLPPGMSPEDWLAEMRRLDASAEIEVDGFGSPAYRAEKNTPLTRAFLAAIRRQGGEPAFVVKSGTADLNILAPHWGCPALAYGPGDSALDHTPHEHLLWSDYARAVDVLAGVLVELSRLPDRVGSRSTGPSNGPST